MHIHLVFGEWVEIQHHCLRSGKPGEIKMVVKHWSIFGSNILSYKRPFQELNKSVINELPATYFEQLRLRTKFSLVLQPPLEYQTTFPYWTDFYHTGPVFRSWLYFLSEHESSQRRMKEEEAEISRRRTHKSLQAENLLFSPHQLLAPPSPAYQISTTVTSLE